MIKTFGLSQREINNLEEHGRLEEGANESHFDESEGSDTEYPDLGDVSKKIRVNMTRINHPYHGEYVKILFSKEAYESRHKKNYRSRFRYTSYSFSNAPDSPLFQCKEMRRFNSNSNWRLS
jgi:hypothetical protein